MICQRNNCHKQFSPNAIPRHTGGNSASGLIFEHWSISEGNVFWESTRGTDQQSWEEITVREPFKKSWELLNTTSTLISLQFGVISRSAVEILVCWSSELDGEHHLRSRPVQRKFHVVIITFSNTNKEIMGEKKKKKKKNALSYVV